MIRIWKKDGQNVWWTNPRLDLRKDKNCYHVVSGEQSWVQKLFLSDCSCPGRGRGRGGKKDGDSQIYFESEQ